MKIIGISKSDGLRTFLIEATTSEVRDLFEALSNDHYLHTPDKGAAQIGREFKITSAVEQIRQLRKNADAVKRAREGLLALAELLQNHEYVVAAAIEPEASDADTST